ncbi:MAG: hypothetical protein E6929_11995 [Clostridium sp.]|nr:hypothetical protein [Clostridium sp.]
MGLENNREVERNVEQDNKLENDKEIENRISNMEKSFQSKDPYECKTKEYENRGEDSLEKKNLEEPKESREDLEKRLNQIEERKSSPDYDRLLPSERAANDSEEKKLNGEGNNLDSNKDINEINFTFDDGQEFYIDDSDMEFTFEDTEESFQEETDSKMETEDLFAEFENIEFDLTEGFEEENDECKVEDDLFSDLEDVEFDLSIPSEEESNGEGKVESDEIKDDIIFVFDDDEIEITDVQEDEQVINDLTNEVKDIKSLDEAVIPFEESNWDKLGLDEKKLAICDLKDSVIKDLNIKEAPDVHFYTEDDGSYGYYNGNVNEVFVNENYLDDAFEAADTIAHELKHCEQYERASNPKDELDYEFRENFLHYISPEKDYEEYENQLLEVDARNYGESVTDRING